MAAGAAIALMSLGRCLHPPGGACALLCALGATGPEAWGWGHLIPIAANLLALAGTGWLYNNLTGHPWPHRAVRPPEPAGPWAYTHEDLARALEVGRDRGDRASGGIRSEEHTSELQSLMRSSYAVFHLIKNNL